MTPSLVEVGMTIGGEVGSATTGGEKSSVFPETRWSLVLRAQEAEESCSRQALEDLCRAYWYPIYAFARSRSLSPPDAEDATQSFFMTLFRRNSMAAVSKEQGKLRAFFLSAMKNYLASQWREEKALKRGGDVPHIRIDRAWAENGLLEVESSESAECHFDRNWAYALLTTVSSRLEKHYDKVGQRELYESIKECLQGDGTYDSGEEIAVRLGLSHEAVRSAVFRLRRRFRDLVEEEIADTCAKEEDIKGEIAHLCRILAG